MVFGRGKMLRPVSETVLPLCTKTVGFRVSEGLPTLNDTVLDGGHIIMGLLSQPLQQLVEAREPTI